jgi:hypothetical protein
MLFKRRVGFSGTPSALLPLEMGETQYEKGADGLMLCVMNNPAHVSYVIFDLRVFTLTPSCHLGSKLLRITGQFIPCFDKSRLSHTKQGKVVLVLHTFLSNCLTCFLQVFGPAGHRCVDYGANEP